MMEWKQIKAAVSGGFEDAKRFQERALGMDLLSYEHGVIGIEYVATVKIAERLFGAERVVCLERHAKDIRKAIHSLRKFDAMNSSALFDKDERGRLQKKRESRILKLKETAAKYIFGKKDSERIDIVVLDEEKRIPKVAIEIKIFNGSLNPFYEDIRRVAKLVQMCADFNDKKVAGFIGVASIYFQKVGKDETTIRSTEVDTKIKKVAKKIADEFRSTDFALEEVLRGEEPFEASLPLDYIGEQENELLRDKMGYRALAVIVTQSKPNSSSSSK